MALSSDLETFLDDLSGSALQPTPFRGNSADYATLAGALKERLDRGEGADSEHELLAKIEEMAEKARSNERAQALLDVLTDPRRREQYLIDEGLCLQCSGMGVGYVSVGGTGGGRTCVSCSGCGGSGKLKDYKKHLPS